MAAAGGQLHNLGSYPVASLQELVKEGRHMSAIHPQLGTAMKNGVMVSLSVSTMRSRGRIRVTTTIAMARILTTTPKFWAYMYDGSGMMVDQSAHPQHTMNGLKHLVLVYGWSGCGNHSMWVLGLNQSTFASFVASL